MAIERDADDVARCFLLERELRERGWDEPFDGEVIGADRRGRVRRVRRRLRGAWLPGPRGSAVRRIPGDWWELNEQGTILHATRDSRRRDRASAIAMRVRASSASRRRRAVAST